MSLLASPLAQRLLLHVRNAQHNPNSEKKMSELEKLTDEQIEELVFWIEDHKEIDQETLRYVGEMVVTIEKCRELNRELPNFCVGFDQMDVEEYSQTMSVLRDIRELYSDTWLFGSRSAAMYIKKLAAMYPDKYEYLAN